MDPEVIAEAQDVLDPMAESSRAAVRAGRNDSARELQITKRLLTKFGHSDNCAGCFHSRQGLYQRPHTPACRTRIYMAMQDDEGEQERLGRAIDRMLPQHRAEMPSAGEATPPEPEESNQNVANDEKSDDLFDNNAENLDGIPEGIEEMFEGVEAEIVEDDDSDEENVESAQESKKRDREVNYEATSPAQSSRASSGTPLLESKRPRRGDDPEDDMLTFEQLIGHVDAKEIIEDLEQDPRLRI